MKVRFWFHACARQVVGWIQWNGPIWSLSTGWEQEWMKAWEALDGHPQLMPAILWNKSYCWLLCNLARPRCCSIMPCSRLLSSYCSASFHFSLLLLLNTTLPCKSLMHFCVTQSVLWKQSSSCGLPEPRVCAPWLGRRGGMRAAKKFSPSKNINCNVASGSREILLEWVYHGKIGKNPKS